MRYVKLVVMLGALALLAGSTFHQRAAATKGCPGQTKVVADGGAPLPRPPLFADGGAPLPRPPLVADGGAPLPRPPLVTDGGAPLPRPPLVADGGAPLPRPPAGAVQVSIGA